MSAALSLLLLASLMGAAPPAAVQAAHLPTSTVVTLAGSFQQQIGCSDNWQEACPLTQLAYDSRADAWRATFAIPAGGWEYKVTINQSWSESYPASNAVLNLAAPANVQFTFARSSHAVSHTVLTPAGHDNDIRWADLGHNSRDPLYRTPTGPVTAGSSVKLRLRAASGDLTAARVRLWNDRTNVQSFLEMAIAADDGTYEWWEAAVPASSAPTIFWYRFVAIDGTTTAYHEDDGARLGGWGETFGSSPDNSWQLTVYDPAFETPEWVKNAVIYQVFPDRFRDGDPSNNPLPGEFFYGETPTLYRSGGSNWNTPICDPRGMAITTGNCANVYSQNFYGGDLQGILDQLDYLEDLGITALYLNPIFRSPSNHKYDTTDFTQIDPAFGDQAKFQQLAAAMHSRGMRLILDGVFNHTSSDSIYFDRYDRYDAFVGACESAASPYRSWYFFQPVTPGTGPCVGDDGTPGAANYESWFGYDSLPKLRAGNSAVRDFFYAGGANAVGPYWMSWADGWRLDVAGDVDPGLTNDPGNDYWEGFRQAVRAANSNAYIVGEEWGMATAWTLGNEWDATMNYQLSSALLSFFRDTTFVDNDHNSGSSAGTLSPIGAATLVERILNLEERYPPEALAAMMNLLGSHDTNRPLFMLDHNTGSNSRATYENPSYDWSDAISRLRGVLALQATLPGAPTLYYGDEIGLVAPPTYDGSTWQDDPYNRVPYPWLDESGTPYYQHLQAGGAGQTSLLTYYSQVLNTRNAHPALRGGDLRFLHSSGDVVAYGRKTSDHVDAAVVVVNRGGSAANLALDVSGYLPIGLTMHDPLGSGSATVAADGSLSVSVAARKSAIFTSNLPFQAAPAAVDDLAVSDTAATSASLAWSASSGADAYDVYRSLLSGGGYGLVGSTAGTSFSDTGLSVAKRYHYVVVARDSATGLVSGNSNEATALTGYDLSGSWRNVQWPPSLTHTISTTVRTDTVYGQIWIDGVTSDPGPAVGVRAQLGWGPVGSTPDDSWSWEEMEYNVQAGNNDEYKGSLLPDEVGSFEYTIRYSGDNGATWHLAIDGPGGSGDSPIRPLTVNPSSDAEPPDVPVLSLAGVTASSVSLSWTAATDETALAGYELFRDGLRIATLGASTTTHTDSSVTTGVAYDYHVRAFDTSFNRSADSNTVQATPENRTVEVTFTVGVPDYTPPDATVYVTGSIDELGPFDPSAFPMTDNGDGTWSHTFTIDEGTSFQWKYTRGSWETVEQWDSISGLANRGPIVVEYGSDGTMLIDNTATDWGTGPDSDKAVRDWRDPLVAGHSPADGATDVALNATVGVTFSKPMQAGTTFSVSGPGGAAVAGSFTRSNADMTFTFTPASELAGGTQYDVLVSGQQSAGGDNQHVPASFSFTTEAAPPVNTPPQAVDDEYDVEQDGVLVVEAPGVLANDSDADEDPLSAVLVDGPEHGTLDLQPDGSFTFTPDPGYVGTDSFSYRADDGTDQSDDATVTITVSEPLAEARAVREHALATLGAMLPTGNIELDKRIEQAIRHLEQGLSPGLWDGDDALDAQHGHRLFNSDKQVIGVLTGEDFAGDDEVAGLVADLVASARALAQAAIDDAVASDGKPKDVARALDQLAKGDEAVDAGRFGRAIDRYGAAWENALKSMS